MTENQMIKNDDGIILQPFKEDIFWCVRPFFVDGDEDGSLVQLQWGWTAGMTEKDFENLADDAPRGLGAVTMTFNDAIELRDKLTTLIEANKHNAKERVISEETQRLSDELWALLNNKYGSEPNG